MFYEYLNGFSEDSEGYLQPGHHDLVACLGSRTLNLSARWTVHNIHDTRGRYSRYLQSSVLKLFSNQPGLRVQRVSLTKLHV